MDGAENRITGDTLRAYFSLPAVFENAIETRFANQPARFSRFDIHTSDGESSLPWPPSAPGNAAGIASDYHFDRPGRARHPPHPWFLTGPCPWLRKPAGYGEISETDQRILKRFCHESV
ncbi:MAG: hypothetical protein R2861_07630 [Desulfobacterales bacterium]